MSLHYLYVILCFDGNFFTVKSWSKGIGLPILCSSYTIFMKFSKLSANLLDLLL